ncbi:helicase-related protein [Arhodomonas sp. KWT2]|uniref:helicase-related protein n=1 Tax=Arhodomonas sp. KWT2 TaxID=3344194 RepID=UPI0035BEBC43
MTESAPQLPIDVIEPSFRTALAQGPVVVSAATGSGKSTRLPLWARGQGRVLVIEPRRLAATSLAGFVAGNLGESPGGRVGHAIRGDVRHGPDSEVVFVTPGIALRWLAADGLAGFATVVLDEFHERRWDTDLLLALLRARTEGPRLVITSATIQGERLAGHLGAELLEAAGRAYPVSVHHLGDDPRGMPDSRELKTRLAPAVERALAETEGHVLVFLPGRGEIADAARALGGVQAEVIALHAGAPAADQRRALSPEGPRRVILATNVAETSLTVPGVTAVVDSGLERRTMRRNGRTVLALQAVSRASADQRRGRAGRTAPGVCLRLWGERAPLAEITPPEVVREDLTELVLAAACAGRDAAALEFPEAPPDNALAAARARLQAIAALDETGTVTERGRRLFSLPVDAWLAHLVVAMPDAVTAAFMADLAAALSAGRGLASPPGDPDERERLGKALGRRCDATLRVAALRGVDLPGVRVDRRQRTEAGRLAAQLREAMDLPGTAGEDADLATQAGTALRAAAVAMPELVHVRRTKRREALANGQGEAFPVGDSLFGEEDEAALVLDDHSVPGRRGTRQNVTLATCLSPLPLDALPELGITETRPGPAALEDDALVGTVVHHYAERTIREDREVLTGPAARRAAASLILEDRLLAPAGARLREDIDAWALYVALGHGEGEVPEPQAWLAARLGALGMEEGADLALIEPEDLAFDGVPGWERDWFDRTYPREVRLTDLHMRVHYDVRRREVVAEKVSGVRKRDPRRWELPVWSGWRVKFRQASREVEVR